MLKKKLRNFLFNINNPFLINAILFESNPDYLWKETSEAKIPFDDKQVEWLKENSIKEFDKLTSEKEIHSIIDFIVKIQRQYENKEGYEMYMFIKSILDLILDSI